MAERISVSLGALGLLFVLVVAFSSLPPGEGKPTEADTTITEKVVRELVGGVEGVCRVSGGYRGMDRALDLVSVGPLSRS